MKHFFEGLHLKEAESTFDQVFYTEVNTLYDQIKQNSFDITGEVREKDTQGENKDTHFGCLNDDQWRNGDFAALPPILRPAAGAQVVLLKKMSRKNSAKK